MNRRRLLIILPLLSITIAEFTTGSTPLTNIITDPASFFLFSIPALLGLYGCGVLLIREASLIWNKGLNSVLVMGIAYGIMEEGVSVHTFFAPVNATVGIFGTYGRVFGLDLTWAIIISLFHSVYSIALPILISGLLWPDMKEERLLGRRSFALIFIAYVITVLILDVATPYRPAAVYTFFLTAVSASLIYLAGKMPARIFRARAITSQKTLTYLILGVVFFPFIIFITRLETFLPYPVLDVEIILVAALIYRSLEMNVYGKSERKLSVLTVGLIIPLVFFGFIISASGNPLGVIAIAAMAYVAYKVLKLGREKSLVKTEKATD